MKAHSPLKSLLYAGRCYGQYRALIGTGSWRKAAQYLSDAFNSLSTSGAEDIGEGPWPTYESAEEFLDAEVGVDAVVMPDRDNSCFRIYALPLVD